jgi:2'-hydroxyisoflavone reductase
VPRLVRAAAELLRDRIAHYTFVSSISVYADFAKTGMDESAALGTLENPATEEVTPETYGPLKALCEQEAAAALPGRVLSVRPGLIVGPHDPTDRFTYWPVRLAAGGEVLAPAPASQRVQIVDARDLAEWIVRMAETKKVGTFNATGPDYALTLETLLDTCRYVSGSTARISWVDESFLLAQNVRYWVDLPAVVPQSEGAEGRGMQQISSLRAINAGLRFRPVATTVRDTLAWSRTRSPDTPLRAGLTREREAELLRLWQARR